MNGEDENNPEIPNGDGTAGELAALQAEAADLKDRLLRALAEAENTRRRAERDRIDASQYAVTRFARDILGVADNFARAINALAPEARAAADPQVKAVLEGIEATERQLLATLENHGIKPVETEGRFDPNLHQAIAEVAGEGKPAGTIMHVVQSGYRIGDRLLRPAMVTVARGERADAAASEPGGTVDTKV
jgi:molecular chaperone GrpE